VNSGAGWNAPAPERTEAEGLSCQIVAGAPPQVSNARDPGGTIRRTVDAAGNALGQGIQGLANATGSWFTRAGDSIRTGDYRGAGRQVGQVTGELAMTFVPGLGVVGKLGLAGRLASAGGRVTSLAGTGAALVGNAARAIPVLGRGSAGMAKALSASKSAVGAGTRILDDVAVHGKLQYHSIRARLDVARQGMTRGQREALVRARTSAERNRLQNLFRGQRHDTFLRKRVGDDGFLMNRIAPGPRRVPKGGLAPDFVRRSPRAGSPQWYDLTTRGSWQRHRVKYRPLGDGARVFRFLN
jgi:hypothetical protein